MLKNGYHTLVFYLFFCQVFILFLSSTNQSIINQEINVAHFVHTPPPPLAPALPLLPVFTDEGAAPKGGLCRSHNVSDAPDLPVVRVQSPSSDRLLRGRPLPPVSISNKQRTTNTKSACARQQPPAPAALGRLGARLQRERLAWRRTAPLCRCRQFFMIIYF
jgi:hypothetical protein